MLQAPPSWSSTSEPRALPSSWLVIRANAVHAQLSPVLCCPQKSVWGRGWGSNLGIFPSHSPNCPVLSEEKWTNTFSNKEVKPITRMKVCKCSGYCLRKAHSKYCRKYEISSVRKYKYKRKILLWCGIITVKKNIKRQKKILKCTKFIG